MNLSADLLARGVARGVNVAASLAIMGTINGYPLFAEIGLQPDITSPVHSARITIVKCLRSFLAISVSSSLIWLGFEAIYATGSHHFITGLAAGINAIPPLLDDTNFGHLLMIRLLAMAAAVAMFGNGETRTRILLAGAFAVIAVVLQAGLGHGAAMGGAEGHLLFATLILHLLAAGLWLGGLPSLLIVIKSVTPETAFRVATRFSRLGVACVITIAITAAIQAWYLIGSFAAFTNTDYGLVALGKITFFAALIALAATNRWLTSRMPTNGGQRAKALLYKSITIETAIGLAVIILAGILMELPTAMDMVKMGLVSCP